MTNMPIIIFDTDMDTDCDDAGALLMLINAHLRKEVTLAGVICDSVCKYAAPFTKGVLDYYGLDVEVGEVYGHVDVDKRYDDYLKHQDECQGQAYNKMIATDRYATVDFPSAVELYKKLLQGAADGSVTVLCVGMLTAIHEVLKENLELFRQKVCRVVIMGNPYKKNDFNFSMDAPAAQGFFELCPSPVFVSYLGGEVITGNYLDKAFPPLHPVRQAYKIWAGEGIGRSSWDLIATLFAAEPSNPIFKLSDPLQLSYDERARVSHINEGERDRIITLHCDNREAAELLNALLV